MEVVILKQAERDLKDAPKDVLIDMFALFDDLAAGKRLSMPISRPLPLVWKGLHELRLSGGAGEYRVFYIVKVSDAIYIIHAVSKKKQTLDRRTTDLLKHRIRSLNL